MMLMMMYISEKNSEIFLQSEMFLEIQAKLYDDDDGKIFVQQHSHFMNVSHGTA